MRRIFTSFLLVVFFTLTATAQIAKGYYYLKNTYTNRYISLQDNNSSHYSYSAAGGNVKAQGCRTIKSFSRICVDPGAVFLVENKSGNQYNIQTQGSSLAALTGGKGYIELKANSDGSYKAKGVVPGTGSIDIADSKSDGEENWMRCNNSTAVNWRAIPVNASSDYYFGIKPDVQTNDGYFGTIYADFAFKLVSSGMKAYYINAAGGSKFTLKEITGTIPAKTPVIIKCSSNDPANNRLEPVISGGSSVSDNKMAGVYCASTITGFVNVKIYDASSMRVIGKSNGKLAFIKASASDLVDSKYLRANKAYLIVGSDASSVMTEDGTGISTIKNNETPNDVEGTYTLTGVRIPEGVTPQPGIYIRNGKKIVIK